MATVLHRSGYEVFEAADGLQALERVGSVRPDIIIVDIGLPGLGGDELIARLKADPFTVAIPAIVNTAFPARDPAVKRAIAAGAAEVLFKPTEFSSSPQLNDTSSVHMIVCLVPQAAWVG